MDYSDLRFEKHGHVALATLDRPDKLNALSGALQRDILNACDEVNKDDDIRVLVLTGAGRGFCSGVDLTGGAARAAAAAAGNGGAPSPPAAPRAASQRTQMDE